MRRAPVCLRRKDLFLADMPSVWIHLIRTALSQHIHIAQEMDPFQSATIEREGEKNKTKKLILPLNVQSDCQWGFVGFYLKSKRQFSNLEKFI
jgi:hypothetical protein